MGYTMEGWNLGFAEAIALLGDTGRRIGMSADAGRVQAILCVRAMGGDVVRLAPRHGLLGEGLGAVGAGWVLPRLRSRPFVDRAETRIQWWWRPDVGRPTGPRFALNTGRETHRQAFPAVRTLAIASYRKQSGCWIRVAIRRWIAVLEIRLPTIGSWVSAGCRGQ